MPVTDVRILSWGAFELDKGFLVYGKEAAYGVKVWADLVSLYVESGDMRILVDTGIGDVPEARRRFVKSRSLKTAAQVLTSAGATPSDIDLVINTHLHFDHVGGNRELPGARFLAQRAEIEYAAKPDRFQRNAYWHERLAPDSFEPLDGWAEVAPGVTVVPTPGHTPGHQSVVVDASGGKLVFTGDASPLAENLAGRNIAGVLYDPVVALRSLELLRSLGARFVFAHEADQTTG